MMNNNYVYELATTRNTLSLEMECVERRMDYMCPYMGDGKCSQCEIELALKLRKELLSKGIVH